MKFLIAFVLTLSIGCSVLTQTSSPKLREQGYKIDDLVPLGWKKIVATSGDLNKDHIKDIVFVIEHTEKNQNVSLKNHKQQHLDSISRTLAIYFKDKNGLYTKEVQVDNFILTKDATIRKEPFLGVKILKKGVLQIDYRFWYHSGSWDTATSTYRFKFKRNAFKLIGYDTFKLHRITGKITKHHINFVSRKMRTTHTTMYATTPEKVIKKRFLLKKLKAIHSLKKNKKLGISRNVYINQ